MFMGLGKNVGKLMKARGLSYAQVARGINIEDTQAIWALVKRNSRKSDYAGRLAQFFQVPLARLVAEDFEVDEPTAVRERAGVYDAKIKSAELSDAEKLLVVIRTFLDTDPEGRNELHKAAVSVSNAHGSRSARSSRAKRR